MSFSTWCSEIRSHPFIVLFTANKAQYKGITNLHSLLRNEISSPFAGRIFAGGAVSYGVTKVTNFKNKNMLISSPYNPTPY